jgi:hypothetical protein
MSGLPIRTIYAIFLLGSFCLLHSSPLSAAARPALAKSPAAGSDYARALAAADHFLQAWQGGDIEAGTVMLTGHAKHKIDQDELDRRFSGSAPVAYEIKRGKLLRRGRYEFPIVLFRSSPSKPQRSLASIIVLNTGNNDWGIDKLP